MHFSDGGKHYLCSVVVSYDDYVSRWQELDLQRLHLFHRRNRAHRATPDDASGLRPSKATSGVLARTAVQSDHRSASFPASRPADRGAIRIISLKAAISSSVLRSATHSDDLPYLFICELFHLPSH